MSRMEKVKEVIRQRGEEAGSQALGQAIEDLTNEMLEAAGPLASEDLVLLYGASKLLEELACRELGDKLPQVRSLWEAIREKGETGYWKLPSFWENP